MSGAQSCYTIGEAKITRILEMTLDDFTGETLFTNWQDEAAGATPGAAENGRLALSVHAWLIEDGSRTILVDTGVGNGKKRPHAPYFDDLATPFLANLAAAGVAPDDVDFVLSTHLHVDHVGWNTRWENGRWVPTFGNARHLFSAAERAFFTDPANLGEATRTSFAAQADSVTPIVEAGLAEPITVDGSSPLAGFAFHPTPGHSPDHAAISLTTRDGIALFTGDVIHLPVEIARPELMTIFDRDVARVRASREWTLAFAADHEALVFPAHFPHPSAGRIRRRGSAYEWHPLAR